MHEDVRRSRLRVSRRALRIGGSGETSNGSNSVIVTLTTIYPGWYRGRARPIPAKVHVDRKTVLTTQPCADDTSTDAVYTGTPDNTHTGRDTTNSIDGIDAATGLMTLQPSATGHLAVINLGVDV